MSLEEKCKIYFDLFSNKQIIALKEMFSDDIELKDWEINSKGLDKVLKTFLSIFKNVHNIKVTLKDFFQCGLVCFCILEIVIDNSKIIVLDKITFDENNLITSIDAYRQF